MSDAISILNSFSEPFLSHTFLVLINDTNRETVYDNILHFVTVFRRSTSRTQKVKRDDVKSTKLTQILLDYPRKLKKTEILHSL